MEDDSSNTTAWWRSAVIYQIYPRSFCDANQDGIGDLSGIVEKLGYVAALGVDIVWISPFYVSPMKDFGYDVADHQDVDPMFGQTDDFMALVEKAKKLGLKVMVDMVLSHTSDQHLWFRESRSSKDNAKADWYIWADPQPDGSPPNNWLSIFGGSAWEWDTHRRQFYLHNFLSAQPDLNFHNPAVVEAVLEIVEFWLRLGVAGIRLDTVNWYFHDQKLRDNPPNQGALLKYAPASSNYVMQDHIYNKSRPEVLPFLEKLRGLLDRYSAVSLGELTAKRAVEMTADYTEVDKRLHMVYTFGLLTETFSAAHFKQTIREVESQLGSGWVCWAFSNHDVVRVVSRWRREEVSMTQQAKFLLALLLSLRGAVCLYQGEELGLTETEIAFEDVQDPYGIRLWPEFKGRDGCRTPMPWQMAAHNGGFSAAKPWLPVPLAHLARSVDVQLLDEASVLNFCRFLLQWRKSLPAVMFGAIRLLEVADPLLAFERSYEGQTVLAIFNLGEEASEFDCSEYGAGGAFSAENHLRPFELSGFTYGYNGAILTLPGLSVFFAEVVV
ncbi:MAG: alpha-glucosidase [Leptolyngbya foveolarum]|uniref:Alpha-glucosidase n=1 Tax=Leptolyngbya foveolarum TaxID=47253 RepID=A0A2W4WH35_9CYAN|nr:MAG: alpha-glucosidase [Leptolyngbya foveolarum]